MPFDMNSAPSRKSSSSPYSGGAAQAYTPKPSAPPIDPIPERQDDRPPYQSSSFQNPPHQSSGFQNRPERHDEYDIRSNTSLEPRRSYDDYAISTPVQPPRRRGASRRPPVRHAPIDTSIPWNMLLLIIGIICVIAFVYLFRNEISSFLSQILSWAITIVIIVLIFKWIFHRR